ncbi:MAG: hypothetical protein IPN94_03530 [Sphingobacteriales bacterium]|nr:hypothetical protein [Sphingobacteriales bacterium]
MQEILFILAITAAVYVVLLLSNRKKGFRYRQFWSPVAAALLALFGIYFFYDQYNNMLAFIKANASPTDFVIVKRYLEIIYSLSLIFIFGLIKMGVNGSESLFQNKPNTVPPLSIFSVAYKIEETPKRIVLRKEWVFPNLFLEYLMWISVGLFILLLMFLFIPEMPYLPILIAFSLLIVLESHWYLQHPDIEKMPETPNVVPEVKPQNIPDYYPLWEEYQKVWFDKILLAWQYKSNTYEQPSPPAIQIVEAQNLVSAGYKLTVNDYHLLECLTNRDDVLVDDVISDNVAPLLFSVFIRRLMDGENILVLTAKRCTADSKYHQQVVAWMTDWFYKLTGNSEFWRVQIFSKVEDVELSSRIIVTSANDILEKNIINHQWFDSLQTVLLLNGNEIFSESLTSNNVLLRILRTKNDRKDLQCIVLSDYRESLQSSVARNLSVKSDLKEVRLRPTPPAKSFTLFWRLEGDKLFQHKVLSGHIEKYLGAEALLSLLAQREKLPNIQMVGQEKLPYYEYLEELDNNNSSLLTTPVSAQSLKGKSVNEVKTQEVTFLISPADHSFILARDADFNLISTLKKWEPYARQQAFLHIVSPPYLLRSYFLDNMAYFIKTPLYPLSAKMMISRFEVARILLERMVSQELSEQEILEEISWINPKAIFVKEELQKLFKLAFGIDIIASNYLTINSSYNFNKADDSFAKITKYRLQPRIKDDINLKFLRNVDVIDASKNVLKLISSDLLFQNYLPNQIHAFNGKAYSIKGYDQMNRKLLTNHRSPDSTIMYRADISVTLHKIEPPLTESHKKKLTNEIALELSEGTFDVINNGYFTFNNGLNLQKGNFTYTPLNRDEVPARQYTLGRMMFLRISIKDAPIDIAHVTATLSILLHEVFYTLFPDTHQYIIVGGLSAETCLSDSFAQLYPVIQTSSDTVLTTLNERMIQLCILEDAYQDLGLVQSIFDRWDYVLRIVDDYLDWVLDTNERTSNPVGPEDDKNQIIRKLKINKTEFLQFGGELLPDFIDLKGTAALLRQLLGKNYLSTERRDFYA